MPALWAKVIRGMSKPFDVELSSNIAELSGFTVPIPTLSLCASEVKTLSISNMNTPTLRRRFLKVKIIPDIFILINRKFKTYFRVK